MKNKQLATMDGIKPYRLDMHVKLIIQDNHEKIMLDVLDNRQQHGMP